ncbi:PHD finger protein PERSISTENT TAPETAL CELL 1 [Phoenix dactylifera]|uniref:PHD finger protein PERSISTENT TAPETAL CELL 1 n=1 Tax=Phoenix dactylifera TaxID=42345 RepID=A0A8B9AMP3_PHODC|nr:PHD finger protein PERSISTENT TAPETAL CELL 1 [Phoenix dactylifera]
MAKMHNNLGGSRKRKRGDQIYTFDSFGEPGQPTDFNGTFQENIEALLGYGHLEAPDHEDMKFRSFQLELHRHPQTILRLFIVEELVGMSLCRRCRYCHSAGWGHHMICNKRYHFVLPAKDAITEAEELSIKVSNEGFKKATTGSKSQDLEGHLLHGVIHSNGFGHLLCINGFEGGSYFVSGHQILDLWDRICGALQVRKVSLIDEARKGTMELRLIHGVAYGESWFGQWGYKFGHGSYGITHQMYKQSLEALRALPLCLLIPHFAFSSHEISMIVTRYQGVCSHTLGTLGQLFHFMIELKARLPQHPATAMDYHGIITEATCRWSVKRVEMAAQVIVEALKKSQFKWVTRQEVRDAARNYIGDTGLLDYVLKSLGNHIVGNYIVRRMVNPVTKVLEYCLEDISSVFPNLDGLPSGGHWKARVGFQITRVQIMRDMLYLYKHILKEQRPTTATGIFGAIPMAVRMILDIKHLVKDCEEPFPSVREVESEGHMKLTCMLRIRNDQTKVEITMKELPPYDIVAIPIHARMANLKEDVERYFRETYWGLKSFVAEMLIDAKGEDSDLVSEEIKSGTSIIVEGRIEKDEEEIYECGKNNGMVDCPCGAREEDGERMVCCDICEVWQHTRCVRIPNDEDIPHVFLCRQCENGIVSFPSIHH